MKNAGIGGEPQDAKPFRREIKSFVVRGGRLTPSQQRAMDELWPRFGLGLEDGFLDQQAVFGRKAPLVFEIGFGMGDSLVEMAARQPEQDYIGVDVHPPGIGTILKYIEERELSNLRIYEADAVAVLQQCIADASIHQFQIYFPDPWHKKRHHKRRLIQAAFVQLLRQKLASGGVLHIATDWENYAEYVMEVMVAAEGFENCFGAGAFASEHDRPQTKFERRGRRLGHGVWDMLFRKTC